MIDKKRKLKHYYDITAKLYKRRYRRIQERKFRFILKYLRGAKRVLDVGCGTGMFLNKIARNAELAVGVDLSTEMLKESSEIMEDVILISADADALPFRNGSFDAVVTVTLLQNMPDPKRTICELARVVKSGGVVVMTSLKRKHSAHLIESWAISAKLKPLRGGRIPDNKDVFCVARR